MPAIPAPDYEFFDVANYPDEAKRHYANCKEIYRFALVRAGSGIVNVAYQLLIAREYDRAAKQLRHRYQSHFKSKIDEEDTVDEWPEPMLVPGGAQIPAVLTTADMHEQFYQYLAEHHPNLLPYWPKDETDPQN